MTLGGVKSVALACYPITSIISLLLNGFPSVMVASRNDGVMPCRLGGICHPPMIQMCKEGKT